MVHGQPRPGGLTRGGTVPQNRPYVGGARTSGPTRATGCRIATPGGAMDFGETAAECAIRECREETGITAEITGFLGVTATRITLSPTPVARFASSTRTRASVGRSRESRRSTTRQTA
ncbi:NUDIX hydrolase [Nocardia brasiliensis]|uniref:NUDIX hydrolase n=1 Tax=Nocardia brasiliensis TaxID=37326 RepID=UPI003D180A2E